MIYCEDFSLIQKTKINFILNKKNSLLRSLLSMQATTFIFGKKKIYICVKGKCSPIFTLHCHAFTSSKNGILGVFTVTKINTHNKKCRYTDSSIKIAIYKSWINILKHCQCLWQCSRFWHRAERVEWYMKAGERWRVALLLDQSPHPTPPHPPTPKKLVWMNMLLNDFVYLLIRIQPGLKTCVYALLTRYWMYSWFLYWKPSCYFSDGKGLPCSVIIVFSYADHSQGTWRGKCNLGDRDLDGRTRTNWLQREWRMWTGIVCIRVRHSRWLVWISSWTSKAPQKFMKLLTSWPDSNYKNWCRHGIR